jgi:hypothetical protein
VPGICTPLELGRFDLCNERFLPHSFQFNVTYYWLITQSFKALYCEILKHLLIIIIIITTIIIIVVAVVFNNHNNNNDCCCLLQLGSYWVAVGLTPVQTAVTRWQ